MASTYEIVNSALDGHLAQRLRDLRKSGKSIAAIRVEFSELGFDVSGETVRNWLKQAGIPTHRVPAA